MEPKIQKSCETCPIEWFCLFACEEIRKKLVELDEQERHAAP